MKRFFLILSLFSLSFCSHHANKTADSYTQTQESIDEDQLYKEALDTYRRDTKIYENFETKVILSAVYMSPSFQKALQTRFKQLLDQNFEAFQINDKEVVFFVSVYTPFKDFFDLKDQSLWHIKASIGGQENLQPQSVQLVTLKQRWTPYFDFVSTWSKEYLVSFQKPSSIKDEGIALSLSSSLGKVALTW